MRLIDSDKIMYSKSDCNLRPFDYAFRAQLEALPAVDAVPVVRCGECKHYGGSGECQKLIERYNEDCESGFYAFVSPDDFCSYGERKDDEANDGKQ